MPASPYFPNRESDQIPWFGNLKTKINNPSYLTPLGTTSGEVTTVQGICTLFIYTLETFLPAVEQFSEACTAFTRQMRKGIGTIALPSAPFWSPPVGAATPAAGLLTALFDMIARWKTAPGYSESIGDDLGILGTTSEAPTAAPVLTLDVGPDGVTLRFIKKGHMGISLESQRQGVPGWTFLAIDTDSPYLDNRPPLVPGQAEWREYRARYWDGTPVGDWSAVVRANVG